MRRLTFAAAALIALLSPAFADDGCGKFAWPLAREQALFAAADKASVNAGAVLAAIPKTAFVVHLQPGAQAIFTMPPERQPRSERWFGGAIRFPALDKPGIYQVTLSEEAGSTWCRTTATPVRWAAPAVAIVRAYAKACGLTSPPRRSCCRSVASPRIRSTLR